MAGPKHFRCNLIPGQQADRPGVVVVVVTRWLTESCLCGGCTWEVMKQPHLLSPLQMESASGHRVSPPDIYF